MHRRLAVRRRLSAQLSKGALSPAACRRAPPAASGPPRSRSAIGEGAVVLVLILDGSGACVFEGGGSVVVGGGGSVVVGGGSVVVGGGSVLVGRGVVAGEGPGDGTGDGPGPGFGPGGGSGSFPTDEPSRPTRVRTPPLASTVRRGSPFVRCRERVLHRSRQHRRNARLAPRRWASSIGGLDRDSSCGAGSPCTSGPGVTLRRPPTRCTSRRSSSSSATGLELALEVGLHL
jgi:hypothetical protein